jgi:prepilin-type N-terminal cleavage/methylation domain-containing protein
MDNHIEVEETKNKGFTLVELLIVIVILGILATVTVFAVTGITNKGKVSACQSDAKTIETAEEAYSANTGTYTANQQLLVDTGLMHSKSKKLNVVLMPANTAAVAAATAFGLGTDGVGGTADDVLAIPVHPLIVADSYYLTGVFGDCQGLTFT